MFNNIKILLKMPLKAKDIPKICIDCGEKDESNFSKFIYDKCKDCKKLKSSKQYSCIYCGVKDITLFYKGRYGNCKKCYASKKKEKVIQTKFLSDEGLSPEDKPQLGTVAMKDTELRKFINQVITCDATIMEGLSVKQKFLELTMFVNEISKDLENLKKENQLLRNDKIKIVNSLSEINDQYMKIIKDKELIIERLEALKL